jgi:hypothetical protein
MKLSTRPQKFRAASSGNGAKKEKVGSNGSSGADSSDGVQARIASLAYQLYEQRGREDGHDVEDWIQAEQAILVGIPAATNNPQL